MLLASLALAQAVPPPELARDQPCTHQCDPWGQSWTDGGWEYIGSTPSGSDWYVHRATTTRYAQYLQIWVKTDHSRDRTVPARMTRGLALIECEPRRYHWESVSQFAADGRQILNAPNPSYSESVAPGTMMEAVWRAACQRQ